MFPDSFREEYYRSAAARIGALSDFTSILRDQLHLIGAESGRVDLLVSRDAALLVLTEYRNLEERYIVQVRAGVLSPEPLMEALIACRRRLAAALTERLIVLLDNRIPQEYPGHRILYFSGEGELTSPPGE